MKKRIQLIKKINVQKKKDAVDEDVEKDTTESVIPREVVGNSDFEVTSETADTKPTKDSKDKGEIKDEVDQEEPEMQGKSVEELDAMDPRQRKLFELRLKMNQARRENRKEAKKEHERLTTKDKK